MTEKDRWDKWDITSKVIAALLIPVIAGIYTCVKAKQESQRQDTEVLIKVVEGCNAYPRGCVDYIYTLGNDRLRQGDIQRLIKHLLSPPNANTSRANAASAIAEVAANPSSRTSKAIEKAFKDSPPRVYIHISGDDQRKGAERIAEILRAKGYLVPDIIRVGIDAPSAPQVRYFSEKDESGAKELINLIQGEGGLSNIQPNNLTQELAAANIEPKHFELYFAKE